MKQLTKEREGDQEKTCKHLKYERITTPVEKHEESFSIDGCCGGGCYVVTEIRFCPFCGENLFKSGE